MMLQGLTQLEASLLTVARVGVVVFLIVAIAVIGALMIRVGVGTRTLREGERSWLDYGNFFVLTFGIAAVLIGFFVILLFPNRFTEGTQALGFLTALFGAIAGLVGTFFGVKASADARSGAENLAREVGGSAAPTTTIEPTITIEPPSAENLNVNADHTVTATVTSADGTPAPRVPVTFTITAGPDMGTTQSQDIDTNEFGQASFTFTNNGVGGTDTVEAAALGGRGTATATFR